MGGPEKWTMTITNKSLSALTGLTVILLVVTILVLSHDPTRSSGTVKDNQLLIQGLDVPLISQIKVHADGKQVTLQRKDDQFLVMDRENYPASTKEVNGLLMKVLEIRCHEVVSESPQSHKELGVADDGKGTKVELLGKDGKSLATVLVGSNAKTGGNYVRLLAGNTVYATQEGLWGLAAEPASYLRTRLIETPENDIISVTVAAAGSEYTISRDKDNKPQLQGVPPGKRVKQQSDVDEVFKALTNLDCEDVTRTSEGIVWSGTYSCQLKNHLRYDVRVGKKLDKHYVAARAVGPTEEDFKKSQELSQNDSKQDIAKKTAPLLQASVTAQTFNATQDGWNFQLNEYKAKNFTRSMADLVEAIPPATKPATAPPATTIPPPKK
jgi:hypothetical protein